MIERKITDPEKKLSFNIYENEDFEKKNPIEIFMDVNITLNMSMERKFLIANKFHGPPELIEQVLLKRALQSWDTEYKRLLAIDIPENLFKILETDKKKDQVKALKDLTFSSSQLMSFAIKAYINYGYLYSCYRVEFPQTGLDISQLPKAAHVTDNKVEIIGKTGLSEGQLRQAIDHRKVIISKFIDNADKWHCFFLTYNSLKGGESYNDGTPHMHYISSAWGIDRAEVVRQLKSKTYKLPSLPHINFIRHHNEIINKAI